MTPIQYCIAYRDKWDVAVSVGTRLLLGGSYRKHHRFTHMEYTFYLALLCVTFRFRFRRYLEWEFDPELEVEE